MAAYGNIYFENIYNGSENYHITGFKESLVGAS
jgi:hypothetical protein